MLPTFTPQPKPEPRTMQVFLSNSGCITTDDFQWSEINTAADSDSGIEYWWLLGSSQQPSSWADFFTKHSKAYLQLPKVNHLQLQQAMLALVFYFKEQEIWIQGTTQYKMAHSIIYTLSLIKPLKLKQVSILNKVHNGVMFEIIDNLCYKQSLMINKTELSSTQYQ